MQLKKKPASARRDAISVGSALAAATCALLGQTAGASESVEDWTFDSAVLYYSESDRVTAVEPVVRGTRTFDDDSELSLKLTFDSLTGASHNGAIVSDTGVQTFTSPSGSTIYRTNPGDVPLDDTFKDTRSAVNGQYTWNLSRTWRATTGLNYSTEYDFTSLGANAGLMWDLNERNSTLTLAFAHESDTIDPVGGVPTALTWQSDRVRTGTSSEDRSINDFLLGWTQVMNRRWIMQLNYNLSASSGYHTDPYKVVTLVDAAGNPEDSSTVGATDIGDGDAQLMEQRPDSRTKHAVYWENRYTRQNDDVVAMSYRFMTDDWGINSHTVDLRYRWKMQNDWFLQPHVRWYSQSAADFWRESITVAEANLIQATQDDVSADYRLGDLTDVTVGLKFGRELASGSKWNARLEFFQQSGDTDAADVDALIGQVGYTFYW